MVSAVTGIAERHQIRGVAVTRVPVQMVNVEAGTSLLEAAGSTGVVVPASHLSGDVAPVRWVAPTVATSPRPMIFSASLMTNYCCTPAVLWAVPLRKFAAATAAFRRFSVRKLHDWLASFSPGMRFTGGSGLYSPLLEDALDNKVPDAEMASDGADAHPGSIGQLRGVEAHRLIPLGIGELPVVVSAGHESSLARDYDIISRGWCQ